MAQPPDSSVGLRKAAVLIPLLAKGEEWFVLFTRRSNTVNDHKGQVSFPGGAVEAEDDSDQAAALREANEEIGILKKQVEVLGQLEQYPSITGYLITPVVARIDWPFEMQI